MLITRRLAIIVTLKCTLNCKICCNCVPLYKNPPLIGKNKIFEDMKCSFEIFDRIEWFQFVGGELFLHPDIGEIIEESFKYSSQFDKLILMTNATVIPSEKAIEVLSRYKEKVEIHISDYGKLSYKIEEFQKILIDKEIPFVIKSFHGDMQHYGGWVDAGNFEERNYPLEEIKSVFNNCWQISMGNLHLYNGQIHNCIRSLFATDLGYLKIPKDEYIDLRDNQITLCEKKEIARNFNTRPLSACKLCGGFDSQKSKRYVAAEQI